MSNKEKGFAHVLLVLIVLVILGIGGYLYLNKDEPEAMMEEPTESMMMEEDSSPHGSFDSMEKFDSLEEPEGTPEEINNEALNELDALMLEVDSTATGEDLSDL